MKQIGVGFVYNKTNYMNLFHKFILAWNSTCFGQFLCPSLSNGICHTCL